MEEEEEEEANSGVGEGEAAVVAGREGVFSLLGDGCRGVERTADVLECVAGSAVYVVGRDGRPVTAEGLVDAVLEADPGYQSGGDGEVEETFVGYCENDEERAKGEEYNREAV